MSKERGSNRKDLDVPKSEETNGGATPALSVSRRSVLAGPVTVGASMLLGGVPAANAQDTSPILDSEGTSPRSLGRAGTILGERSPHERITRFLREGLPWTSGTPIEALTGTITPSDLHFERHHSGVPAIDPARYALMIHGMVERPMVFGLTDLKRFPSVTRVHFLECSGHYPWNATEETRPSRVVPLLSNSEWTGVPLSLLLKEVGVQPEAKWLLAEGQDAGRMTRSCPIEKAFDDALIVYGQNGEALRPEQGYPARLFNPGWEGSSSIKWLRRIELTDRPAMTRDETVWYTDGVGERVARMFSYVMDARSLIVNPGYPATIAPGMVDINGVAWSGRGRISRVEVSLDDRRSWQEAELQSPVLSKAFTRFRLPWRWSGEETTIWSRATDETGYVQPTMDEMKAARANRRANYHGNFIVGWRVRQNGSVVYRTQEWPA